MGKHLTFAIVPECDVLLALHGVEVGEPFELPIMWHEQLELMSHVFSRPSSYTNRRTGDEQMEQY
jgi:hypothetical protein